MTINEYQTAACIDIKMIYEEENMEQEGDIDDIFMQ